MNFSPVDLHVSTAPFSFEPRLDEVAKIAEQLGARVAIEAHFPESTFVGALDFSGLSSALRKSMAQSLRSLADVLDPREARPMTELNALREYADNWDDEGAPRPDEAAIGRAVKVLAWLDEHSLKVVDLSADVLGGVDLYVESAVETTRSVWIACMNVDGDTAVLSEGDSVVGHFMFDLDGDGPARILAFLGAIDADARH